MREGDRCMINLNDLTVEDLKDIEELQKFRKESQRLYNIVINKNRNLSSPKYLRIYLY